MPDGQSIDINWTIDQATGTCAASAMGGPVANRAFSSAAMNPFTYVMWLEEASPLLGTVVVLDDRPLSRMARTALP